MAYYVKKGADKEKQKKQELEKEKKKTPREKSMYYQILGCVIVLVVVLIIGAIRGWS